MAEIDVFKEVLIALRQILRTMEAQSKVLARQTGLSTAQFIALQLIDAAGRMTAGELARELLLSQGTVTSIQTMWWSDVSARSSPSSPGAGQNTPASATFSVAEGIT